MSSSTDTITKYPTKQSSQALAFWLLLAHMYPVLPLLTLPFSNNRSTNVKIHTRPSRADPTVALFVSLWGRNIPNHPKRILQRLYRNPLAITAARLIECSFFALFSFLTVQYLQRTLVFRLLAEQLPACEPPDSGIKHNVLFGTMSPNQETTRGHLSVLSCRYFLFLASTIICAFYFSFYSVGFATLPANNRRARKGNWGEVGGLYGQFLVNKE